MGYAYFESENAPMFPSTHVVRNLISRYIYTYKCNCVAFSISSGAETRDRVLSFF